MRCERGTNQRERERGGRERAARGRRKRDRYACGPMDVHVLHWVVLRSTVSALRRTLNTTLWSFG